MPNIGAPGYILLIILALLLFGPNKLPELGRAVGRTFREFKNGARDILSEDQRTERKDSKDSTVPKHPRRRLQKCSPSRRINGYLRLVSFLMPFTISRRASSPGKGFIF